MIEIIDFLKKYTDGKQNTEKVEISVFQLNRVIKTLEQEPKEGHWIADVDRWGDIVTTVNGYRCDKCNTFNSDKDNYCPNCGCRMVEPQESEE